MENIDDLLFDTRRSRKPNNNRKSNSKPKSYIFYDSFLTHLNTCILIIIIFLTLNFFNPVESKEFIGVFKDIIYRADTFESLSEAFLDLFKVNKKQDSDSTNSDDFSINTSNVEALAIGGESEEAQDFKQDEYLVAPDYASFGPIIVTGKAEFPVKSGKVSSIFGYRSNPFSNKNEFHRALDIAADKDEEILAILSGKVINVSYSDSLGNYIEVDHGNKFISRYAHCNSIQAKEGDTVNQGQAIAKVGSTGQSTGNHLHLEIIRDSIYLDPGWLFGEVTYD